MALDMEGEFYKLAKDILGKYRNLYKMTAISPQTGRVTIMGADNFMVVSSSILKDLTKGKEEKAYKTGKKCAKAMFNSLMKEFDEEVKYLESKKMFDLGLALSTNTGWGELELVKFNRSKNIVRIRVKDSIELKYKKAKHHSLTCGFLAGISTVCMRKDMVGKVDEIGAKEAIFSFSLE